MLIQNTSSAAQVSVPIRFASDGGPNGVAAQPSTSTDATQGAVPQVVVPQAAAQQPSDAQLTKEVNKINAALQQSNKNLELSFSVDQATNRQVVKLMDKTTGDTLLQYPSEAVLAISQGIDEFQHGLLLRQKA